jgi:hypothetical protein
MTLTNVRWWETGAPCALAVEDGLVRRRGDFLPEPGEPVQDGGGKMLVPAWIDNHCHILPTGLFLASLDLAGCDSAEEALDRVRARHREQPEGWLLAVGYDQNRFADVGGAALDAIAPGRPVLLRHVNGHASVANGAALRAAGIAPDAPDPEGGKFVRDAAGHLTGVLLEAAHERVSGAVPVPSLEAMVEAILLAGEKMAELGIACASDMMTGRYHLERELAAYRLAAERGCRIRTRLYVQWREVFGPRGVGPERFRELIDLGDPLRCRVAGIKLFADGAIGSATAAIYGSYASGEPAGTSLSARAQPARSGDREVSGTLMYRPEKLTQMTREASDAGYAVAVHAIGDYAVDLVLDAFQATGQPDRHRIEHAMILSDAQIERMASLGCRCTFQPEFLLHFGRSYLRQLGPERTARLKRARSVLDAGIRLSFSSDRPIVPGRPLDGMATAISRPEGFAPEENVTRSEAILGYTAWAAEANDDGRTMGTLVEGSCADFLLFDAQE